jgi:hypothetical protein
MNHQTANLCLAHLTGLITWISTYATRPRSRLTDLRKLTGCWQNTNAFVVKHISGLSVAIIQTDCAR